MALDMSEGPRLASLSRRMSSLEMSVTVKVCSLIVMVTSTLKDMLVSELGVFGKDCVEEHEWCAILKEVREALTAVAGKRLLSTLFFVCMFSVQWKVHKRRDSDQNNGVLSGKPTSTGSYSRLAWPSSRFEGTCRWNDTRATHGFVIGYVVR
jgi:hypothetical protein